MSFPASYKFKDLRSQDITELPPDTFHNPIEKYQFIYHFLPHPHHKNRASLLSHTALAVYCIAILGLIGTFKFLPKIAPGVLGYASDVKVTDLLYLTNKQREAAGLSTLRLNSKLSEAAEKKALHMFDKDYWAHIAPDGTEPWDFILGENYDYSYAGENLAKNFYNSKDVVTAWMNSPSHKDNIMSPNYTEIGFAVVNGVLDGYETTLVVQMFGHPRRANQIATIEEEKELLDSYQVSAPEKSVEEITEKATSGTPAEKIAVAQPPVSQENVLPYVDVSTATKSISISFGVFVAFLLVLDIWYSAKKGILKLNGHTLTHLILLLVVIFGVWFVLKPGVVL